MKTAVRMKFSKSGRAKYISHLDLMRFLHRAVRRSGLPAAYTEGFHPRMMLTLAAALSLGFESNGEIMELHLNEEIAFTDIQQQMQKILPEGIEIFSCYAPIHKMGQMGYADYRIFLPTIDAANLAAQWEQFFNQPQILVEKKSKRATREIDLKELTICNAVVPLNDGLELYLCLPAGNAVNVNPSLLMETFARSENLILHFPQYCRLKLLTTEKSEFF